MWFHDKVPSFWALGAHVPCQKYQGPPIVVRYPKDQVTKTQQITDNTWYILENDNVELLIPRSHDQVTWIWKQA